MSDIATRPGDADGASIGRTRLGGYQLIRRNGAVTPFDPSKIAVALTKAFLAVEGASREAEAADAEAQDRRSELVELWDAYGEDA